MSVYTFGAEPRVVKSKAKFRDNENEPHKLKAPLEMAEESIKTEMEKRKFDIRKEQLILFKKNKTKQTPYDLRPAPPPKIEVDLAYFLTEQNLQPAVLDAQNTQTDVWAQNPTEPPYLPQKKGVDVETQIWDDELFNYEREVEPILHVLVSKTLEQAQLEVDEDSELDSIKRYKSEYKERRKIEKEDWENQVKEELKRVTKKNELLSREREKREHQAIATKKLQCIHIAKAYLKGVLHNSLESVVASNYWENEQFEAIHSGFVPTIINKVQKEQDNKKAIRNAIYTLTIGALTEPTKLADPIKEKRAEKLKTKGLPRKIQDPRYRNIRVLFSNIIKPKSSKFGFYIKKSLAGKLEDWERESKESNNKMRERYFQGEENIEELVAQYNDQLLPPSMELVLDISSIPFLSLAVASEPYDYLAEQYKRYWPEVYLYDTSGAFISKYDVKSIGTKIAFLKSAMPDRDKTLKENDDAKILVALQHVPKEVGSLIFVVHEDVMHKSAKENWYGNARYRLLDESTYQSVDYEKMGGILEKAIKVEAAVQDDAVPETRTVVCGRIFKEGTPTNWTYEAYSTALIGKKADIEARISGLGALSKREELPAIDISQWEEEFSMQKAQAAKSKLSKGKKDDTRQAKNASKGEEKKGKTKKDEEEDKKDKAGDKTKDKDGKDKSKEETLQDKLADYTDFPIGPILIDCQKDIASIEVEIYEALKRTDIKLYQKCENGFEIFVNDKKLKSIRQILQHSHILNQIIIKPRIPQIIPQAEIGEAEGNEPQAEGDEEQQ